MLGSPTFYSHNSSFLSIASNPAIFLGAGAFTVEMWVYIRESSIPTTAVLFDMRNGENNTNRPYLELNSTNGYAWRVSSGTELSSGTNRPLLYTWQHIAVCRNLGTLYMYIDGTSVADVFGAVVGSDNYNYTAGSINIGKANNGTNTGYLNGSIADLRVIRGEALYTNNFTVPTSPISTTSSTILHIPGKINDVIDIGPNNISITKNNINFSEMTPYRGSWIGNGIIAEDFNAAVVDDSYKGTWSSTNIGPNYNRT